MLLKIYLQGIRLTIVSDTYNTDMRHLSANGSNIEPSLDDCDGNRLAMKPSN